MADGVWKEGLRMDFQLRSTFHVTMLELYMLSISLSKFQCSLSVKKMQKGALDEIVGALIVPRIVGTWSGRE